MVHDGSQSVRVARAGSRHWLSQVHSTVSVPDAFKRTTPWRKIREATLNAPDERAEFGGALFLADQACGRIVDKLEFEGLYSDSIIVVASDNGGMVKNGGNNYPLRGEKTTLWEVRVSESLFSESLFSERESWCDLPWYHNGLYTK